MNFSYYNAHMVFDVFACAVATYYLVTSSRVLGVIRISNFLSRLLRNGLLYFLVVFLANLWVVLEFAKVFSSGAASSLPLAVVLIAIQHLTLGTPPARTFFSSSGQSASRGPPRFASQWNQRSDVEHRATIRSLQLKLIPCTPLTPGLVRMHHRT